MKQNDDHDGVLQLLSVKFAQEGDRFSRLASRRQPLEERRFSNFCATVEMSLPISCSLLVQWPITVITYSDRADSREHHVQRQPSRSTGVTSC